MLIRLPKRLLALPVAVMFFGSVLGLAVGRADSIFTGSSGSLSASADFNLSGNTLTVTITNTSTADVLVPADVLTGLFFDTTSKLTPVSASLNGSKVYYGIVVNNVGEGWQYGSPVSAHGMNSGISATGLGIFSPSDPWFYTPARPPLDGINYGILSAGDISSTGNGGIKSHGPLIENSIQFTLTAAPGFSLNELGRTVVFQYGSALYEPSFDGKLSNTPIPEPSTLLMLGTALLGLGGSLKRKFFS